MDDIKTETTDLKERSTSMQTDISKVCDSLLAVSVQESQGETWSETEEKIKKSREGKITAATRGGGREGSPYRKTWRRPTEANCGKTS